MWQVHKSFVATEFAARAMSELHLKRTVVIDMFVVSADDHSRVVLNAKTNVSGSDYINASTIVSTVVRAVGALSSLYSTVKLYFHLPVSLFSCLAEWSKFV